MDVIGTTLQGTNTTPPATEESPGYLQRLFVGWVPKHYSEKDLIPLFNKHGVVRDCIVLKDKVTGQPRGAAFVSFATKAEAETAIKNLDRQLHLPGALCPLEVRFAKSHQFVQAGTGPDDNRQLFFSNAPAAFSEEDLSTFFSAFGAVEELNLFRERKTGNSKGSGFVTMATREQALRALESLEDTSGEPGGSSGGIQLKWADPDLQHKKKKALDESNADNRMLFFAKVLRSATEEEVKTLFSRFGKVYDVNLFRAFQGAPTTKGCGLVTMGTHEEAIAAIDALDSKYTWEGMESPMVVKWMDAALQRRRREQHLAAMRQGLVPSMGLGGLPPHAAHPGRYQQHHTGMTMMRMPHHAGNNTAGNEWLQQGLSMNMAGPAGRAALGAPMFPLALEGEPHETPPSGCQPDAIKLFVGNIPKVYTEDQLLPFFETIGKVVELVIVRDKSSHESKGSAFVWYATRARAERAILQFNLRHVLPEPSGEQDRPLVVRKAKARVGKTPAVSSSSVFPAGSAASAAAVSGLGAISAPVGQHHAIAMLGGPGTASLTALNGQYYATPAGANRGIAAGGGALHLGGAGMDSQAIAVQGQAGAYGHLTAGGGYRTVQPMSMQPGAHLVSIQGAPAVHESGLYEAYGGAGGMYATAAGPGSGDHVEQAYAMQAAGSGHLEAIAQQLVMSVALNQQQLALVNQHLFSIQAMSGAQLHVSPGAPGVFHLVISGAKAQVEGAKNLLSTVLGQGLM